MIKKSVYLAVAVLLTFFFSCEKDVENLESPVIRNEVFSTKDTIFKIDITPENIKSVRADNIKIGTLGSYLLGVYKPDYHKKIEASFVSQLVYKKYNLINKKHSSDITSVTKIDVAYIRLPYPVIKRKDKKGKATFKIDSVLGNKSIATSLKVYINNTYLNNLNPENPKKNNAYKSDALYETGELLSKTNDFKFSLSTNDTIKYFQRHLSNGKTEKDSIIIKTPALLIPLNANKIKSLFLDKYNSSDFASETAFQNYLRGIIIKAEGDDGFLVPFNFSKTNPTLEIYYTNTFLKNNKVIGSEKRTNTFRLSGIRNSIYKMSEPEKVTPTTSFSIQGTAGKRAKIKIISDEQLKLLKKKKWLINEASISFYVDNTISTNKNLVPQKLLMYRSLDEKNIQIKDAYLSGGTYFGGWLEASDSKPERYKFRITSHLSDILSGKSKNTELILKVFNEPTDNAIKNKKFSPIVETYNWNPRGVIIKNENSSNGDKKAVLKISYSVKK